MLQEGGGINAVVTPIAHDKAGVIIASTGR
jgi:hypothetical protein